MITDIHGVPIQEALQTEGYVIIDNLIPKESFNDLVEACDRVVDRARRGDWKYRYALVLYHIQAMLINLTLCLAV